jgi:hypothetical protein
MNNYRFLIKDYDGFSHTVEKLFTCEAEAIEAAKALTTDVNWVSSVTLYLMLSQDSCGPIRYIGCYTYGES